MDELALANEGGGAMAEGKALRQQALAAAQRADAAGSADAAPGSVRDATGEAVVEVRDLYVAFGAVRALEGINLSVPPRHILAIIGPSGCGKSTFLRSLNRMNDRVPGLRVRGQIVFHGQNIYGTGVDVVALRRRIGMVFQKPVPFPMTVYENVAYGPRIHGLATSRAAMDALVERSLRQAGLWDEVADALRRPAAELSGGQQQRLAIARALAVNPEVILLDEPTSAIDPIGTARIEDTLQELAERYTLVIVTHNMQQAARISHRTAFFLNGTLVEEGPTEDLFQRPRDRRTEDYLTGRFG